MYEDQIVLDETGCVLNEKMMPDATIMVPDLEIGKKVSKINVFKRNVVVPRYCIITMAGTSMYSTRST
jgi:hypothetical protein